MNRHWDIVATNGAATRFFQCCWMGGRHTAGNILRLMFHPDGLRHSSKTGGGGTTLIRRVHREALGGTPR